MRSGVVGERGVHVRRLVVVVGYDYVFELAMEATETASKALLDAATENLLSQQTPVFLSLYFSFSRILHRKY